MSQPEADEDAQLLEEMKADFLDECQEILDQLSNNLASLEKDPGNEEIINQIFRAAHSIKGSSSFVNLEQMTSLAHKMEDVFSKIREGEIIVTPSLIDTMYLGLDKLSELREEAVKGKSLTIDISSVVADLQLILEGKSVEARKTSESPKAETKVSKVKKAEKTGKTGKVAKPKEVEVNKEDDQSGRDRIVPEMVRVRSSRLDELMSLTEELIAIKNKLESLVVENERWRAAVRELAKITHSMHEEVIKVRLVPIAKLFNKFPGVVRNLARQNGKQVKLVMEGEETELDKNIIEQLYDPLVHLLRNSIDHGIESPAERKKLSKPDNGEISLRATRRHNKVIISVTDDGQGIEAKKVKKAAIDKGLISSEVASTLSDSKAIELIFTPGFSTSKKISNISGRGVGMDVVKQVVQKLRGQVIIDTKPGEGTTVTIELPLTLAVVQVLMVKSSNQVFALPVDTVIETTVVKPSKISEVQKNPALLHRGEVLPIKAIRETKLDMSLTKPAVIVGASGKKSALAVDELLGKQELVLKPLGDYLGTVKAIEGGAILPDGSVTLVLDMAEVI
jgi:two-component system chemotaxis sensor kinase CheA